MIKTLAIASDHGAVVLKESLAEFLKANYPTINVLNLGIYEETSVDYPQYAKKVVEAILNYQAEAGILCCGTGIGMSIAANRFKGIRAALVFDTYTAQMAKAHNNANILCLGGRTTSEETAKNALKIWLETGFEGNRHQQRIQQLDL